MLVPKLKILSEETIFKSNKFKEQHQTMKLQMKKLCLETLKT